MIDSFMGEFRFLSNFQAATVMYLGMLFPTTENAYQAAKSDNATVREEFTRISAKDAKRAGRNVVMREDWDKSKMDVMLDLNRQKFKIPALRAMLLATGDRELIEGNWWHDTYWGVCDGVGENRLGKILMMVRKEIQIEEFHKSNQ
jgi:ribA/ribD-fused uncharacterized protein